MLLETNSTMLEPVVEPRASVLSTDLSGVFATSPEALRRRLFGPWSEGLRQYIRRRCKSDGEAARLLLQVKRLAVSIPTPDLLADPGPRARIYRAARERVLESQASDSKKGSQGKGAQTNDTKGIPYRTPDGDPAYIDLVAWARGRVVDNEAVELRIARELTEEETAFVTEGSREQIRQDVQDAVTAVRIESESRKISVDPHFVLLDAFALLPAKKVEGKIREAQQPGLEIGTRVGGRYTLVERVGVGAFGDVYKADDEDVPGHRVALKILREPSLSATARDAALRELKLIAAVFHPSVVNFKDHGWFEDRLWFVMPWYEGETLEERIKRTPLTRHEARSIFEPLARALATLHAQGIRHQDIKPDNVFLARIKGYGSAKSGEDAVLPVLIDLGVAAQDNEALIGGTPVYFAPEIAAHYAQKSDDRPIGPKSDVFALALTLRNALEPSTEEDVPAGAVEAFIERRAKQVPPLPSGKELSYMAPSFTKWLALDPHLRPTADEFVRELAILTTPEERKTRRKALLAWLLPISFGLIAAFGAVLYVYQRESQIAKQQLAEARLEASNVRADLMVAEARRQALDLDHATLIEQYEQESLSRDQLAANLATAEGQIGILGQQMAGLIGERDTSQLEVTQWRTRFEQLEAQRMQLGRSLETETQRAAETQRRLETLREDLSNRISDLENTLSASRERANRAENDLRDTRAQLEQRDQRISELAQSIEESRVARNRLEEEAREMQRRMDQLRQLLREPMAAPVARTRPEGPATVDVPSEHAEP